MAAQGVATGMKIDEAIGDYGSSMSDISAQISETQTEAARRIGQAKAEGVTTLKDMSRENAYQAGVAVTEAAQVGSAAENKLGASGVKRTGSPLLALQQTTDMATAAAANKIAGGNAGIAIGGLKLGGAMSDINAQASMLTSGYQRQYNEQARKKKNLQENRGLMIGVAVAGGAGALGSSFYDAGQASGWWDKPASSDTTTV
jgi:hypothetical protein